MVSRPTLFCVAWLAALLTMPGASLAEAPADTLRHRLDTMVARPNGLVAATVAERAVATSFVVRRRQHEVEEAAAQVNQAIVNYIPRLAPLVRYARLSPISNTPLGNIVFAAEPGPVPSLQAVQAVPLAFPVYLNSATFQLSLTVPLLDYVLRIPAVHAAARHNHQAAGFNQQAAALQTAADARVLYYTWARASLQVAVAEQALIQAREHAETVGHLFEAGVSSRADVTRIEAQVAAAELFLARARDLSAVLEDQLRVAMHDPNSETYEIGEDLREPLPAQPVPLAAPLIAQAGDRRLEVRTLDASIAALGAQVRLNQANALPRIDAFADLSDSSPNQRYLPPLPTMKTTWDAGVQLTWTLNDVPSAVFGTQAAEARVAEAEAQRGSLLDSLRNEVMQAIEALREADIAAVSTARELNAAEVSYQVRVDLFANGRATSVELTDAESDLTQARLDSVGSYIDQRIARVRLGHVTGEDIP